MANGSIDRDSILAAALALLDRGGLPALAMRRIAGELGVQQGALYWHFRDKQTLLGALADVITAELPATSSGDWRAQATAYTTALRGELLRHRDAAELVASAFALRLGGGAPVRTLTRLIAPAGLTREDGAIAAELLYHVVLGQVTTEQQHDEAVRLRAISAEPEEPAGAAEAAVGAQRFERGIALVLAGIAAQAERRPGN